MSIPAYITAEDLPSYISAKEVVQLSNGVDLQSIIDGACALVHGYVGVKIGPAGLASVPEMLKPVAAAIVHRRLYRTAENKAVVDSYEAALHTLSEVRDGHIVIDWNFAAPVPDVKPIGVYVTPGRSWAMSQTVDAGDGTTFTRDPLSPF